MKNYNKKPLVSVIVPAYNRDHIIENTLLSLSKQTYRPLEIIIVDDGSYDDTLKKVNNFKKNYSKKNFKIIIFANKINKGACFSRNLGIIYSKGAFIQFLDSDDYLDDKKIEIQINKLQKQKSNLAISDYKYIKNKNVVKICRNDGNLFKKIALGWSIYTSSPLIKTTLVKEKLWWNEKINLLQDKDFLFKVLISAGEYVYTPNIFANYVQHDYNQISDQYSLKPPQFVILIFSRLKFLFSFFSKLKNIYILYTLLGIIELSFSFLIYKIKTIFIHLFGYNSFIKLKNFLKK